MGLFSRITRPKENAYIALDIGTEVVKALVCISEGTKGRVIGVGRKQQKLGDMQSGVVTDISSVIANSYDAIKEASKMAGVNPDQMVMGIAGELVKGATITTTYMRKEPTTKIDLSELKNIVHKVQWKAFDQVRSQLAYETGYNEIDVKLVNAAIVDVRIDGYRVSNPIGFQGKQVAMSVFNAFAPLVHFGALQTIAAELNKDLLAIAAEPYAVAKSVQSDEVDGSVSGIFIDVGGGTTDIAVTNSGRLEGTKMFTLGGRSFTKRLSQALNVSFQEAEEIKLVYSASKLEKQSQKIICEALRSDCEVWLSGVVLTLSEFYLDQLPSKIYLCGGGTHLPEIKECLDTREWYKTLPFAKKPVIQFMSPKMVRQMTDETKQLKDQQDITPLSLAHFALDFVGEEQLLTKVLKKVVRLMQI